MPHLVARRWQLVRSVAAAIHPRHRSPLLSKPAFAACLRSYAQQPSQDEKGFPQALPLRGAILIPSYVPDVQPDNFIHHIQPIPRDHLAHDTFSVFLVTPSFASWLLKDDVFLEKALLRLYGELWKRGRRLRSQIQMHALCAVVDKLPAGRALGKGNTLSDEITHRAKEPPVAEAGLEGIAYVTLPYTASVSSTASSVSEQGAIDIVLNEHTAGANDSTDILRLPLANTVFQTGTPITMALSSWKSCGPIRGPQLKLLSKKNVSHHGIRIAGCNKSVDRIISTLCVPLVPLTIPRRVEGCMGNIIRRVINSAGESVTASSELEEVVPQFFKSRGEPAQAATAWALVMPQSVAETMDLNTRSLLASLLAGSEHGESKPAELWECLWRSDPPSWNTLVSKALADGARLHRVLSGGGGWGKKAGLLSLDPVPTSDATKQRDTEGFSSMLDDPEDFASTLTPVINDGDSIQFFISPNARTDTGADPSKGLARLMALKKKDAWGWEFGTIPSSVDLMPGASWQYTMLDSRKVSVFRNTFGALSEAGLTLTRRFAAKQGDPSPSGGTTMVDVPFSRFWVVEVADKVGSIKDPIYASTRAKTLKSITTRNLSSIQHHEAQNCDIPNMDSLSPLLNAPRVDLITKKERILPVQFVNINIVEPHMDNAPIPIEGGPNVTPAQLGAPALGPHENNANKAKEDEALEHSKPVPSRKVKIVIPQTSTEMSQAKSSYPPTTSGELQAQSLKERTRTAEDAFYSRTARKRLRPMVRKFNEMKAEYDIIMFAVRQRINSAKSSSDDTTQSPVHKTPPSSTEQLPETPKLSTPIPTHGFETETGIESRKAVNRVRRIVKKIARLTAEYQILLFTISRRVRFVPSGEYSVETSERQQEVTPSPTQIRCEFAGKNAAQETDKITPFGKTPTIPPEQVKETSHPRFDKLPSRAPASPKEINAVRIRRLVGDAKLTPSAVSRRLRILMIHVFQLTEEYKDIMYTIRQHNRVRKSVARTNLRTPIDAPRTPRRAVGSATCRSEKKQMRDVKSAISDVKWRREKRERRDEFAAEVSSWLAADLGPVSDGDESVNKAPREPVNDGRERCFGMRYDGSTGVESERKQEGVSLLLETTAQQDQGYAGKRRRSR